MSKVSHQRPLREVMYDPDNSWGFMYVAKWLRRKTAKQILNNCWHPEKLAEPGKWPVYFGRNGGDAERVLVQVDPEEIVRCNEDLQKVLEYLETEYAVARVRG